jgi:hypothetical protein
MLSKKISALALLSLLAFAPVAHADPIPLPPQLKTFLMRPEQQKEVTGMMGHQWNEIFPSCTNAKLGTSDVLISEAPTFDKDGAPTSGAWRVVGKVEGCGQVRLLSIYFFFPKNGQMQRVGLLPGDTHADMQLQHDGLMYAFTGMAKLAPKDCRDVKFLDTKYLGSDKTVSNVLTGQANKTWSEEWTLRACGVTGAVPMKFIPDATGTTIVADASKTREIKP